MKIDSERNDIIVEDLDDEHLVIKETKLEELRQRLNQVRTAPKPNYDYLFSFLADGFL